MNEIARAKKRLTDTKMQAAKSQQEVMQLLQAQHHQITQLQVRWAGLICSDDWNCSARGVSYIFTATLPHVVVFL